jgi:hypothetical protein
MCSLFYILLSLFTEEANFNFYLFFFFKLTESEYFTAGGEYFFLFYFSTDKVLKNILYFSWPIP